MIKRVLVVSDTHENYEGLERIVEIEDGVDLVIHGGDFANIHGWDESMQSHAFEVFQRTISILKKLNKPIICVPGNHDSQNLFYSLNSEVYSEEELYILGQEPIIVDGLRFLGLGGAPPVLMPDKSIRAPGFPYNNSMECDLAVQTYLVPHLTGEKTILITHFPPFDIGKIQILGQMADTGSLALQSLIQEFGDQLILTINGHLHVQFWDDKYHGTAALNPGCVALQLYAVLYIETGPNPKVNKVDLKTLP